jgi:hypothetical protein
MQDIKRSRRVARPRALAAALIALSVAIGLIVKPPMRAQAASPPATTAPDGRKIALSFADEFDSLRASPGGGQVWRTIFGDGRRFVGVEQRTIPSNKEAQLYVDSEFGDGQGRFGLNPFAVRQGMLEIAANRTPPGLVKRLGGFGYTSGLITSQPSFSQTYGYFEVRAQLPRGKGLWTAIWMLPADFTWPPEIDIVESIGDPGKGYFTAHSNAVPSHTVEVPLSDGFHTYSVSWDKNEVVWYVDRKEVARQPTPADMHKPMFVLANLAVGGDWAGVPDASTPLPGKLVIDYVRAYRFAS